MQVLNTRNSHTLFYVKMSYSVFEKYTQNSVWILEIVFVNEQIFRERRCRPEKKTDDGQTIWIVQRTKTIAY